MTTRKELLVKLRTLGEGLNDISDDRSAIDWMFGSVNLGASPYLNAIREALTNMENAIKLTLDLEHIKDDIDDDMKKDMENKWA